MNEETTNYYFTISSSDYNRSINLELRYPDQITHICQCPWHINTTIGNALVKAQQKDYRFLIHGVVQYYRSYFMHPQVMHAFSDVHPVICLPCIESFCNDAGLILLARALVPDTMEKGN